MAAVVGETLKSGLTIKVSVVVRSRCFSLLSMKRSTVVGLVAGVDRDGSRFAPSEGIKENEDDLGRAVHLI